MMKLIYETWINFKKFSNCFIIETGSLFSQLTLHVFITRIEKYSTCTSSGNMFFQSRDYSVCIVPHKTSQI